MNSWCFNSIWRNQPRVLMNMKKLFKMQQKWVIFHLNCMFQWLLSTRSPWSALKTGLARLVSERSRCGGHSAFHCESHQTHTHTHLFMSESQQIEFVHLVFISFILFYYFHLLIQNHFFHLLFFTVRVKNPEMSWWIRKLNIQKYQYVKKVKKTKIYLFFSYKPDL